MTIFRKLVLLISIFLACCQPFAWASEKTLSSEEALQSVMAATIDGEVYINPEGAVTNYTIETDIPPKLRLVLEKSVRSWRFRPVLNNLVPCNAQTKLRILLVAEKAGDGFRIKVDNVTYPYQRTEADNSTIGIAKVAALTRQNAKYPESLLRTGMSGLVDVAVKIRLDGSVEYAEVIQTRLFHNSESDKNLVEAVHLMEEASIQAAKDWRFTVMAQREPLTSQDLTLYIPMSFTLSANAPIWQLEVRRLRRKPSWLTNASDAMAGEITSPANEFQLLTAVIGNEL